MDFFEELERYCRTHDADILNLINAELSEGIGIYWKAASRILEGSGTRLLDPPQDYFALKNNFFSMLFLYSYHRARISGERRVMYVSINQCFRGMVTGCDNILDDEYKKTLETDLPEGGARFRSVVDIMVSDRVLFDILLSAMERGLLAWNDVPHASAHSLHALLRSGAQEAGEEKGITGILSPEEVLQAVHHYKTGLLFRAPWQIPRLLDAVPERSAESMMEALYTIGIGCQIMDDMVDLSHDIQKRRHNYVLSLLHTAGGEDAQRQVGKIAASEGTLNESARILARFPEIAASASQKAVSFARNGLESLFDPGHHFLIKPAISFLAKRIGGGLISLD